MKRSLALVALAACSGVSSDPSGSKLLAGGLMFPTWITLAGDELYVVNQADESNKPAYELVHLPKTGGAAQLVTRGHVILDVVADDSGVYWLDDDTGACTAMALSTGDTTPHSLGTTSSGIYCTFRNLALDASAVYFADDLDHLWRIPKSGTGPVMLGTVDTGGSAVATDVSGVWVATQHGAQHYSPSGVADPELVFTHTTPDQLASSDALYALFSGSGFADGSILRVAPDASQTTVAAQLTLPIAIVPDGGDIYFATNNEGAGIYRVPAAGGDVVQLDAGSLPGGLVLDADNVYWTDSIRGQVRRVAR